MKYIEQELKDIICTDGPLAVDTETCGLYGRIRLAQFYQEGMDAVILVNNPNPFELAAFTADKYVIMQNAHYDITCVQTASNTRWVPPTFDDTLYLARLHYYKKENFSLDKIMSYTLGYDPYEKAGLDKQKMQKTNWDVPVLSSEQKLYASIDVYHLLEVFNAVKDQLDSTSYKLDKLALIYALDFQNNGMPILPEVLEFRYAKNLREIEHYNLPINTNSYQQVRPYIGSKESDDLGLATLSIKGNSRAKEVRTVRKLIKQNSFISKFSSNDNRIYGKFLPSARSGRFTSKDQNLEQIPRLLKMGFGYDTNEGRCLIYADYAQLEMRCIAAITGDAAMEKLLRSGADLHDYTAKMLFGENFTPIQRQIAKTANFGLLYGAGVVVFISILIKQAGILLTKTEATVIKRKWRDTYPAIARWQDKGAEDWRNGRTWQTPFGRRYVAKMMTDQLNICNQGFGAEVAKLAMHYMIPEIEAIEDVFMVNFIHDSYIIDCPVEAEKYEAVAQIVSNSMQRAWFEACKTGIDLKVRDLPMPVDVFVGYNWGSIEKDYIYTHSLEGAENYEV